MIVKELTGADPVRQPPRATRTPALLLALPFTLLLSAALASDAVQNLAAVADAAEQYALEQINHKAMKLSRLSARANAIDPRLRLSPCELPLEAFSMTPGAGTGRTTVGVRCAGSRPWTLYVPVQVDAVVSVYTAARALGRGEVPVAGDLGIREISMTALPAGYITSPDDLRNKELARGIREGDILTPNMFRDAEVVRRGQQVIIYAISPGIEVKMAGVAMENGVLGELISVRNLNSGRTIQATVRDTETVMVGL